MADAGDSKSPDRKVIPVQVRGSVYGFVPPSFGVPNVTKSSGISGNYPKSRSLPSRIVTLGDRKMDRKRSGKPRLHKWTGRAFIELGGKREAPVHGRIRRDKRNMTASTESGLPTIRSPRRARIHTEVTGMTWKELAIRYLDMLHLKRTCF